MTRPPPYVIRISPEAIHLAELDQVSAARLQAAGLDVRCGWLGQARIPLAIDRAGTEPGRELEGTLVELARHGVAFGADGRQARDPARAMRELIARGRYAGAVTELDWLGAGRWCVHTLPAARATG